MKKEKDIPSFSKDKSKVALLIQVTEPDLGGHHESVVQQHDGLDVVASPDLPADLLVQIHLKIFFLVTLVSLLPSVGKGLLGLCGKRNAVLTEQLDNICRWVGDNALGRDTLPSVCDAMNSQKEVVLGPDQVLLHWVVPVILFYFVFCVH